MIKEAQFKLVSESPTPLTSSNASQIPAAEIALNWEARRLPDYWDISGPENAGHGWYRLSFQLTQAQHASIKDWAIYIPRHSRELDIYLNNQRLGD